MGAYYAVERKYGWGREYLSHRTVHKFKDKGACQAWVAAAGALHPMQSGMARLVTKRAQLDFGSDAEAMRHAKGRNGLVVHATTARETEGGNDGPQGS